VTKIYLEWDHPWWTGLSKGKEFKGLQFLWSHSSSLKACEEYPDLEGWTKAITGFDPVLDSPNVLLGWIGGKEALAVENMEAEAVGKECTKVLEMFARIPIPLPKRVLM
jgi:hypothetical protein